MYQQAPLSLTVKTCSNKPTFFFWQQRIKGVKSVCPYLRLPVRCIYALLAAWTPAATQQTCRKEPAEELGTEVWGCHSSGASLSREQRRKSQSWGTELLQFSLQSLQTSWFHLWLLSPVKFTSRRPKTHRTNVGNMSVLLQIAPVGKSALVIFIISNT